MEHWKMPDEFKPDPKAVLDDPEIGKKSHTIGTVNGKPHLQCDICGLIFEPKKRTHYIARGSQGLFGGEPEYYDAFDCPVCGCQIIAGERKRCVVDLTDLISDE